MIKWFKRSQYEKNEEPLVTKASPPVESEKTREEPPTDSLPVKESFLNRLSKSLSKTRHHLGEGIGRLLLGKKEIDAELLDELETLLLRADLGVATSQAVLQQLSESLARKQLTEGNVILQTLKQKLEDILTLSDKPLQLTTQEQRPFVILTVGVNGAGKTTSIGKMAKQFQQEGKRVMLAAGDTFRAAAIEQLQIWGERNQIPVIAQHTGADSASVIYDACQSAIARKMDILIIDTAGRLHTQTNLMEELKKVKRVIQKVDSLAPQETMLILDASIGQNALVQAQQFHQAIGLTGITMTKLDGTAKGGIVFAIANELKIPFRYLGIGEGIDDLRPFNAQHFVRAIFDDHL